MTMALLVDPGSAGWRRSGGVTVAKLPGYTAMFLNAQVTELLSVFVDRLPKKSLILSSRRRFMDLFSRPSLFQQDSSGGV